MIGVFLMHKIIALPILALVLTACSDSSNDQVNETKQPTNNGTVTDSDYQCGNSDHPMVGKVAILEMHHHQVAGEVRIIDNCRFEVVGFTYDGEGPNVYFYGGTDLDFSSESGGFEFGPRLNGTVYENDTFEFTVDSPNILDNMNSVSVWCYDFQVSFGDGLFI